MTAGCLFCIEDLIPIVTVVKLFSHAIYYFLIFMNINILCEVAKSINIQGCKFKLFLSSINIDTKFENYLVEDSEPTKKTLSNYIC